jgi:molecular chaperone DnaJ
VTVKRDYYEILGIEKNANADEIKKAWRAAAMQHHPDRNKENKDVAEEKFKEAAEAYEVISDEKKRQMYDQYGHDGPKGHGYRTHDFHHMDLNEIFDMFGIGDIFGGGGGRRGGARQEDFGQDLEAEIEITLEEVASGVEKEIVYTRDEFCEHCGGEGAEPGTDSKPCITCGGYGQVEQQSGFGFFVSRIRKTCPKCQGRGKIIKTPCSKCKGSGRQKAKRNLTVNIPKGIHDGQALKVRGEGEPGKRGSCGDLHCVVSVKPHPYLLRQNNDLIMDLPISFWQAALGNIIEIPTLGNEKANLDVKAGTQPGDIMRLRGQGIPDLRNNRPGDFIVRLTVEIPKKLSYEQKELLQQFSKTDYKHHEAMPHMHGFWDKLKKYFSGQNS